MIQIFHKQTRWGILVFCLFLSCVFLNVHSADVIQLQKGGQKTIKVSGLKRVAVADDSIADVRVISEGEELLIIGLKEGVTDIVLWDDKSAQQIMKVVIGKSVTDLAEEIKTLLSDVEGITVHAVGDKVVLDGGVLTDDDKLRIDKITTAYPEILNLVTVSRGEQSDLLAATIEKAINIPTVTAKVRGDKVILEGAVYNESDAERAEKIANTYVSAVVNLLEISKEMVEIDVHFVQIDYSKGKNIGMNVLKELSINADMSGGKGMPMTTTYGVALNALSKLNLFLTGGGGQIISQPHLSTISGKAASFHSGGEIGYEVSGVGAAGIEWKKYGLLLDIEPVVGRSGEIKTHITVEVSAPVTSGTTKEKAFTVFKTDSDIVCKRGESVVISGLIQSIRNKFQEKTPVLGDVPILNLFFKQKTGDDVNKELVVIVTPAVTTLSKSETPAASSSYQDILNKTKEDFEQGKKGK